MAASSVEPRSPDIDVQLSRLLQGDNPVEFLPSRSLSSSTIAAIDIEFKIYALDPGNISKVKRELADKIDKMVDQIEIPIEGDDGLSEYIEDKIAQLQSDEVVIDIGLYRMFTYSSEFPVDCTAVRLAFKSSKRWPLACKKCTAVTPVPILFSADSLNIIDKSAFCAYFCILTGSAIQSILFKH